MDGEIKIRAKLAHSRKRLAAMLRVADYPQLTPMQRREAAAIIKMQKLVVDLRIRALELTRPD